MFQKVIFTVGARDYAGDEIVAWAEARGDLKPVRDEVRDGITCSLYAEEEGFKVDKAKVQSASEELRYKNQLKQAAETERWLQFYELTVRDFSRYLVRHLWLDRFRPQLDALRAVYVPDADSVSAALWAELVFGGHFRGFARQLARRAALAQERQSGCEHDQIEELYQEECAKVLTSEALERGLRARRHDLIRLEFEECVFPEEAMAQEAVLCVRLDGERLRDVAARSGGSWHEESAYAGDLPDEKRALLQSARPGQILGPLPTPGGSRLVVVRQKHDPALDDPKIRTAIAQPLLDGLFTDIEIRHVTWREDR